MIWVKFGWRNLWRTPRRTLIELASIAGAVFLAMVTVSLQSGMYPKMIEEGTRMGSGHVGFYREGYLELRQVDMTFPADGLVTELERDPQVAGAYARLHVPGLARSSRDSRGAVLMGIDFAREAEINPLLRPEHLKEGRLPEPGKLREAVMGAELARELGLKLGRKFVWMAQDHRGQVTSQLFRVRGMLKTGVGAIDKGMVMVHRGAAGRLLGAEDRAHELAVILQDYREVDSFLPRARSAAAGMPGVLPIPWDEAMPEIASGIKLDRTSGYIFLSFILLLVGIGTANTMLMSVVERVREFGVVRALGLGDWGIMRMVLAEGVVLGIAGSALGMAAGALLISYFQAYGLDLSGLMGEGQEFAGVLVDPVFFPAWDLFRTAVFAAITVGVALAASLYPTYRALRIRPAEAMRRY